jgi:hypothetical protein
MFFSDDGVISLDFAVDLQNGALTVTGGYEIDSSDVPVLTPIAGGSGMVQVQPVVDPNTGDTTGFTLRTTTPITVMEGPPGPRVR